jgi:hypothetical protein
MAILCKTFPTTESALHAAEALRAGGVPASDICVLTGQEVDAIDDDGARRLLARAQVPDDVARRMMRHLGEGEAIMCVQLAQVDLGTAEGLIGQGTVAV